MFRGTLEVVSQEQPQKVSFIGYGQTAFKLLMYPASENISIFDRGFLYYTSGVDRYAIAPEQLPKEELRVTEQRAAADWTAGVVGGLQVKINASSVQVERISKTIPSRDPETGQRVMEPIETEVNRDIFKAIGVLFRRLVEFQTPSRLVSAPSEDDLSAPVEYVDDRDATHCVKVKVAPDGEVLSAYAVWDDGNSPVLELTLQQDTNLSEFPQTFKHTPYTTIQLRSPRKVRVPQSASAGVVYTQEKMVFKTFQQILEENAALPPGEQRKFEWLLECNYKVVKPEDFVSTLEYLSTFPVLAFDTETTGLRFTFKCLDGEDDRLVGIVLCGKLGESFYFPMRHTRFDNICDESDIPEVMEKYFKPLLAEKEIVTHNGAFDWRVAYVYGINTHIVADTMVAVSLTFAAQNASYPLALKEVTRKLLHRDSLELSDFVPEGKWSEDVNFADMDEESTRLYACADADNTLALYYYFASRRNGKRSVLEEYGVTRVFALNSRLVCPLGYSEFYGGFINPKNIPAFQAKYEKIRDESLQKMREIAGRKDFNPSSSKQLSHVMFEVLKMPVLKYTNNGAPSTDKKVGEMYAKERNPDGTAKYPFAAYLLEYRDASKMISDFVKPMDELYPDGFFHSRVRQFLNTGRMSTSKPNYQSISGVNRRMVTARDGFYCFDCDFSSIEYRVLSSVAGQQNLVEQFFDPDFDYHRTMAAMLNGVPYEEVTSSMRKECKVLNFGIPYGMGIRALAQTMFGNTTAASCARAQQLNDAYFAHQPQVKAFFERTRREALENSWNASFFGFPRFYNKAAQSEASIRRAAGNLPIQGTAADIFKLGICRLFDDIFRRGLQGRILLTTFVHDELFIEVHKSVNPALMLKMAQDALQICIPGWCPLYIGAGFGRSWYEAKKTELPVQVQNQVVATLGQDGSGGVSWWDGDASRLVPWEVLLVNTFKRDSVLAYLKDESNRGKTLSPVVFGHVSELLHDLADSSGGCDADGNVMVEGIVLSAEDLQQVLSPLSAGASWGASDYVAAFSRVFGCEGIAADAQVVDVVVSDSRRDQKVSVDDVPGVVEDVWERAVAQVEVSGAAVVSDHQVILVSGRIFETVKPLVQLSNAQVLRKYAEIGDPVPAGVYRVCVAVSLGDNTEIEGTEYFASADLVMDIVRRCLVTRV